MKPPLRHPLPSLCLTIPSRIEAAEWLCLEVRSFVHSAGLTEICFPVELLARECLINAVIHGNRRAADKKVVLSLSVGRQWIRLQVSDQGRGFDWRKARRKELDTALPSGRGLQLCAIYAERVRFNRSGNHIAIWIRKRKGTGKDV